MHKHQTKPIVRVHESIARFVVKGRDGVTRTHCGLLNNVRHHNCPNELTLLRGQVKFVISYDATGDRIVTLTQQKTPSVLEQFQRTCDRCKYNKFHVRTKTHG